MRLSPMRIKESIDSLLAREEVFAIFRPLILLLILLF